MAITHMIITHFKPMMEKIFGLGSRVLIVASGGVNLLFGQIFCCWSNTCTATGIPTLASASSLYLVLICKWQQMPTQWTSWRQRTRQAVAAIWNRTGLLQNIFWFYLPCLTSFQFLTFLEGSRGHWSGSQLTLGDNRNLFSERTCTEGNHCTTESPTLWQPTLLRCPHYMLAPGLKHFCANVRLINTFLVGSTSFNHLETTVCESQRRVPKSVPGADGGRHPSHPEGRVVFQRP